MFRTFQSEPRSAAGLLQSLQQQRNQKQFRSGLRKLQISNSSRLLRPTDYCR